MSKKGAPDENSDDSRRWNVVKSVAGTSSGDNLAKEHKRGCESRRDDCLWIGNPKAGKN